MLSPNEAAKRKARRKAIDRVCHERSENGLECKDCVANGTSFCCSMIYQTMPSDEWKIKIKALREQDGNAFRSLIRKTESPRKRAAMVVKVGSKEPPLFFDSATAASKHFGLSGTGEMFKALGSNGKIIYKGYRWYYVDKQEEEDDEE